MPEAADSPVLAGQDEFARVAPAARTHSPHDPVRCKRRAAGNPYPNDAAPGRGGPP